MRPTLEIYWGSGSPNAWRVLLAAEVKGLPYESRLLEFSKGDLRKPEFLALNPRGKVPTIRDGDYVLYESLAIMAYFERKQPEPSIFGRSPEEMGRIWRAISEFECYSRAQFFSVTRPIVSGGLADKHGEVRAASDALNSELARLEQSVQPRHWLAGATVSAVDLAIYPFLKLLVRVAGREEAKPLDLGLLPLETHYPKLGAWMKQVEQLPGYERTYPPHWR